MVDQQIQSRHGSISSCAPHIAASPPQISSPAFSIKYLIHSILNNYPDHPKLLNIPSTKNNKFRHPQSRSTPRSRRLYPRTIKSSNGTPERRHRRKYSRPNPYHGYPRRTRQGLYLRHTRLMIDSISTKSRFRTTTK